MKTLVTQMVAGTRGGLGRILLTAFMLLAIVPLSIVSYLAIQYTQRDVSQTANNHLNLVADSSAAQVEAWLNAQRSALLLLVHWSTVQQAIQHNKWADVCLAITEYSPYIHLEAVSVISAGQTTSCALNGQVASDTGPDAAKFSISIPLSESLDQAGDRLVAFPDFQALESMLAPLLLEDSKRGYLLNRDGQVLWSFFTSEEEGERPSPKAGAEAALRGVNGSDETSFGERGLGEMSFVKVYTDALGKPVVGAYRWLADGQVILLIEQPQEMVLRRREDLATILVASTLAVALLTTTLATVITRQLTRPIVQLTMSAVKIANGDLSQQVDVSRRDEIGVLARAFNIMTAELRSLYEGLEQKVAERTRQLTEANAQLLYQAMQLTLSAEIGRVATSILDLDELLDRVTQLILDSYALVYGTTYVGIFLQDVFGEWVELHTGKGIVPQLGAQRIAVGDDSPIGQVAATGRSRVQRLSDSSPTEETGFVVAVPLRIGSRVIGVLDLYSTHQNGIDEQDVSALESLGDQISVAIENARVYAAEHETVEKLSRLDHIRLSSLSAGSRELATALNNIIGFSRLILKGADGPLTDLQRADLVAIHKSGYQLLGLIDNVITLSELESGAWVPERRSVDVAALLGEVVATTRQRLVDVAVGWQPEGTLPAVRGDETLLRQAFLGMLVAAAEQIPNGQVEVRASAGQGQPSCVIVYIGRTDDVLGRMASPCPAWEQDEEIEEMNIDLTLSTQIIKLHQGSIHLQLDMDLGLSGVVMLPAADKL